jgi:hypothetical protein
MSLSIMTIGKKNEILWNDPAMTISVVTINIISLTLKKLSIIAA